MDTTHFLEQIEQLFELSQGSLDVSNVIEDVPGWSSLTFLGLIAIVDEMYHVVLKPRQVHQCSTFADLFSMVEELQSFSVAA